MRHARTMEEDQNDTRKTAAEIGGIQSNQDKKSLRFSEDADIVGELVHLQEQAREMRSDFSIECVRRVAWGMYAIG